MNKYEVFFLEAGFNWTLAKALPYGILLLVGALASFLILKKFKFKKWLRAVLAILVLPSFFLLYFVFYPIYQGDFSNGKRIVKGSDKYPQITEKELVVIALPNCPFCYEAMDRMFYLKKRDPKMQIEYIVCSSDSTTMKWYTEKSKGRLSVNLANDPTAFSALSNHSFPAFAIRNSDGTLSVWSNDSFGVRALDEVEEIL
jgi:hypothetical protein